MKLRSYQRKAINDTLDYLETVGGNPVIAMPTGTGKSLVIAALIRYFYCHENKRLLVLTHVKELIEQNHRATLAFCPQPPDIGIYSAGLNRRDIGNAVMFAGIASVHQRARQLGHLDFVIIDECHLVPASKDTMYRRLLDALWTINPDMRVIGLSATPYRLDNGSLTKGGVFNAVCHDVTCLEDFNRFIADGWLVPVIPCETNEQISIEGVHRRGGDYVPSELQAAVDKAVITRRAIKELVEKGVKRKHWLIFSTGIKHNRHIVEALVKRGISAVSIDSKCTTLERSERIRDFKSGKIRAIVNANILTTGFDFPGIDLIGMLRPMCSPGLWVQSLGRGTRPAPGKRDCLVLDYAGNTRRLGPINDVVIPYRCESNKTGRKPNLKKCPKCSTLVSTLTGSCTRCGYAFPMPKPPKNKIREHASTDALIAKSKQRLTLAVDKIKFSRHKKEGSNDSIRVTYICGGSVFREWLFFDNPIGTFMYRKSSWFWHASAKTTTPRCTDEALLRIEECRRPKEIEVDTSKKYPEILKRSYAKTTT